MVPHCFFYDNYAVITIVRVYKAHILFKKHDRKFGLYEESASDSAEISFLLNSKAFKGELIYGFI